MPDIKLGIDASGAQKGASNYASSIQKAITTTEQLQKQLNDTERELARTQKELQKTANQVKRLQEAAAKPTVNRLNNELADLARVGSLAIGPLSGVGARVRALGAAIRSGGGFGAAGVLGLTALVAELVAVAQAGIQAERDLARIEGVIQATGGAAGFTTAEVNKLAQGIADNTLASARGAREAAAALLTFRSVSGDTFERTLKLSQDLADLGFGNMQQSAVRLAKALEDPVTQLAFLRRTGISFTKQQSDLIKGLAESGRLFEAQSKILDVIEGQLGGVGEVAGGTVAGAWDSLTGAVVKYNEAASEALGLNDLLRNVLGLGTFFVETSRELSFGGEETDAARIRKAYDEVIQLEKDVEDARRRRDEGFASGSQGEVLSLEAQLEAARKRQLDLLIAIGEREAERSRLSNAAVEAQRARSEEDFDAALAALREDLDPAFKLQQELEDFNKRIDNLSQLKDPVTGKPRLDPELAAQLKELAEVATQDPEERKSEERAERAAARLARQQADAIDKLRDKTALLKLENELTDATKEERKAEADILREAQRLEDLKVKNADELLAAYAKQRREQASITEETAKQAAIEKAEGKIDDRIELLRVENELRRENEDLAAIEVEIVREKQRLEAAGVEDVETKLEALRRELLLQLEITNELEAQEDAYKEAEKSAERLGKTIENSIVGAIRGISREFLGEMNAIESIAFDIFAEIAEEAIRGQIAKPLAESFQDVFSGFSQSSSGTTAAAGVRPPSEISDEEVVKAIEDGKFVEIADLQLQSLEGLESLTEEQTGLWQGAFSQNGIFGQMLGFLAQAGPSTAAGIGAGSLLGNLLGTKQGAGSAIFGTVGGLLGNLTPLGPIGGLVLGGAGTLIGSELTASTKDVFAGRNPLENQSGASGAIRGAALGSIFGPVGFLAGGIIGGLGLFDTKPPKIRLQIETIGRGGETEGVFERDLFEEGPFGIVGLGSKTKRVPKGQLDPITQAILRFDNEISIELDRRTRFLIEDFLVEFESTVFKKRGKIQFSQALFERSSEVVTQILQDRGVGGEDIDDILFRSIQGGQKKIRKLSAEDITTNTANFLQSLSDFDDGIRELAGNDIAQSTLDIEQLEKAFAELAAIAPSLGSSIEEVEAAFQSGIENLRSNFTGGIQDQIVQLVDPFQFAINEIIDSEEELLREAEALGVGFDDVVTFINTQKARLLEDQLAPVNEVLRNLELEVAGPLEDLSILRERFEESLQGTDSQAVAEAATAFLDLAAQTFGRTDLLSEQEAFVKESLEGFNDRMAEMVFSTNEAIGEQTTRLLAAQEEQVLQLLNVVTELQNIKGELKGQREDLELVLDKVA